MKAVRYFSYGDPSVLEYIDVPVPDVGEFDVLLRVRATSITNRDVLQRQDPKNIPGANLPLPFQLGREGAGEVAAVGSKVTLWKAGDRVILMSSAPCGHCEYCRRGDDHLCVTFRMENLPGRTAFGAYAEYIVRPETHFMPAPAAASFETLACTMHPFATALNMAYGKGNLSAGQQVLVTGATGAVGLAAVAIARVAGAKRVIGTAGGAAKAERLLRLGADAVIDYRSEDVAQRARELTGGKGVDLVLDTVGGTMFSAGLAALGPGGTLVTISILGAEPRDRSVPIGQVSLDTLKLFFNCQTIAGTRGSRVRDQQLAMTLLDGGLIEPVIDRVFPLSEIADAHRYYERREHVGRVAITV